MKLISFPNLQATDGTVTDTSASFPTAPTFKNKDQFRRWSSDKTTEHAFVAAAEGINPHARIGNENPVSTVFGFIVDYDSPAGEDALAAVHKKGGNPSFINWSYSGHIRLVWAFETPILVQAEYGDEFLAQLHKHVNAVKLFPGYDSTSAKVNQVFEIGRDWKDVGPALSDDDVQACLFKAVSKGGYVAGDIQVPVDVVAAEVEKRWPGKWPGEFVLDARGPLFWLDDGVERHGCQVKPDGMLCYSERAGKGFMKWRELLGNAFVSSYETKKYADHLKDYWYDGKNYWRTDAGYGLQETKEDVQLALRKAGFSPKARKGAPLSEVEDAMYYIQREHRVDFAAPAIFHGDKVVTEAGGRRFINLSRIVPIYPASSGDPNEFPFVYEHLMNFLDRTPCPLGIDPLDYLVAWMQRIYVASVEKEPLSGQALVLPGPAGRGKTLWARKIIGGLCGGYAEAGAYLTGKTNFNKELSTMPIWTVDDQESAINYQDQRRFTELMKKAVANPSVRSEAKNFDSVTVPWTGRVIMGANLDAHSLSAIPSLDQSNRDKLMAFLISEGARSKFPSNREIDRLLAKELPHFGRWLLDWEIPEGVVGDARYGVRSYFHPLVEEVARDSSPRQHALELLEIFVQEYRQSCNDKVWEGTCTQLMSLMQEMPLLRGFTALKHAAMFSRDLSTVEEYGSTQDDVRPVKSQSTGRGKIWTISLDKKYDVKA